MDGSKFKANEAAMTGEPIGIAKSHDKDPFLLSGTTISEGSGRMAVVAVGSNSQWGVILKTLIVEPSSTPLQDRLDVLVVTVGNFGIGAAIATFVASMIRWIVNGSEGEGWDGVEILDYLINSVTIVVVAIPEGLPLAITLGLAFAMRKMMADQNLVRRLEACETMGSATQLNADKTGTLTQNRMTVTDAYLGGTQYDSVPPKDISDEFAALLAESVCVNSDANLAHNENGTIDHIGSKTECALLQMVEDLRTAGKGNLPASTNFAYVAGREKHEVAQRYHFTSARKRMSTAVPMNGGVRLHVKGASEIVVKLCTKMMQTDGSVTDFSADDLAAAEKAITDMASTGLRTLCIAYVDLDTAPGALGEEPPEANLTLLGVAGIKDPIRPETAEAVRLLRQAGVVVRMVTGDNKLTAEAICADIGIFTSAKDAVGRSFTGREFADMPLAKKKKTLSSPGGCVFSRAEPKHKQDIVRLLKDAGEIVAMTGDGVNDAPALKLADIGIAMGITGTAVAKEASDMVLADDNFSSIVDAISEGRSIYNNMKAFIRYMISSNVGEVVSIFLTAALGMPEGLIPVQLLWVNLVTDGPPATALGFNPPDVDIMTKKPRRKDEDLISSWALVRYLVVGLYVGAATVGIFAVWYTRTEFWGIDLSQDGHTPVTWHQLTHWGECDNWKGFPGGKFTAGGEQYTFTGCNYFHAGKVKASTLSLTTLVVIEMFNACNAISEDISLIVMPPWINPWLILAMFSSFALHFLILYVPALATIFSIVPLDFNEWMLVCAAAAPVWLIDEVLKFIGRNFVLEGK